MPRGQVPDRFRAILESKALGHLATVDADGRPQVNPVWFLWDGERVLMSVKANTLKYRNLRGNPSVAISIADPVNPQHYLELRGTIESFELYLDLQFVNRLSRKYTDRDMDPAQNGLERYRIAMNVDSWTGQ